MRLPVAREDGYYLIERGQVQFVPIAKSFAEIVQAVPDHYFRPGGKAEIISFPRRERAIARAVGAMVERAIATPAPTEKVRFVSKRCDQIDAILDELDGYRGDRP